MKKTFKARFISTILAALMVCLLLPVTGLAQASKSFAAETVSSSDYYFEQLTDLEKGLYNSIKTAHESGVFKSNGTVDLIKSGAVSSADVREYSQGNNKLPKAFQVAKDAYLLDHPELFYIDFEKLSMSLGTQNGKYVAVLDSGKYSTYYYGGLPQNNIPLAISNFYGANGYEKFIQGTATTAAEKVVMVARNIMQILVSTDDSTQSSAYSAYNGRANAEGCAKLLKVCLDKLNIPCLVVYGYLASESTTAVARHCFNYVSIDGRWLAFDLFLNEVGSNEDFSLVRAEKIAEKHIVKNMVYGNFEFEVPELESFKFERAYTKNNMLLNITYNGMNASHLLFYKDLYIVQILSPLGASMTAKALFTETEQSSQLVVDSSLQNLTYAVTAEAPDGDGLYADLSQEDLIVVETFKNEVYGFNDQVRPLISVVLAKTSTQQEFKVYEDETLFARDLWSLDFTFDESLKATGDQIAVKVSVNGKDITSKVEVSNLTWSDTDSKRITFNFLPSESLAHQGRYCFEFEGLVSAVVNDDITTLRPVYINFENTGAIMADSIASTGVFEEIVAPKLAVNTSVENLALKLADTNALADINDKDLILVTRQVSGVVLSKQTVDGQDAEFYHLSLNANKRQLSLNDEYVQVIFPKTSEEVKSAKVYHIDESGDVVTAIDCVVTETGVVASINKLGNFKIVYEKTAPSQKVLRVELINRFGDALVGTSKNKILTVDKTSVTISLQADDDYAVEYVLLNGVDVTSKVKNNNLEILKSELAYGSNLKISFISSQKKLIDKQNNFSSFDLKFFAGQQLEFVPTPSEDAKASGLSKGALLAIIVGAWVGLCAIVVLVIVILKKKSSKKPVQESSQNDEEIKEQE